VITFRTLPDWPIPTAAVWLLTDIAEAKGREQLYARQSPHVLKSLREMALIQSAESSNRIEGVTVERERLRPLVIGAARPRDRSEQEIHGYRRALDLIHGSWAKLEITPRTIRRLHALCMAGSGDAGRFKRIDNEIVELRPGAPPLVRFRPLSAADTPAAMDELCRAYRAVAVERRVPPLVAAGALTLDFLCVHPFRDGNGRVSRLLTLLALYQQGHEVGRYVSTERLIEDSRDEYYDVLRRSSEGWHSGRHDLLPWLAYFLSIVRRAYAEFEARAGDVRAPRGAKTQAVLDAVQRSETPFTIAELERRCPGVGRDMVRRVLRDLKSRGAVSVSGRGPAARWMRRGNTSKKGQ
jgi:Fic family protein